jgi:hypothetical protein
MSVLHQMGPIFLLIQFVVVLVALVSALLMTDPHVPLLSRRSSRRAMVRPIITSRPAAERGR